MKNPAFWAGSGWFLLNFRHVRGLGTFLPVDNLELDSIALLQAFVAVRNQSTVVYEDVWSVIAPDKSKTFGVVEPLYGSFQFHVPILPGGGPTHRHMCGRSR